MEVTLLTENTRARYTGDGVLKEFSYPFNPIDLSYVKVYKNLQPVTAPDVTISSGVVTFNIAPAEGDSIVIIREKPLTYDSGIVSKGIISPDSLDNLAVELLGQIQQVNEKLDRVPVYPIDTTMTGEEIINEFNQNILDVKNAKESANDSAEESKLWADKAESFANQANLDSIRTNCPTAIPQDIKLEINNGNIVAADTCTVYKGDGSTYTIPASTNFSHATSAGTFMLIWTGSSARHQNINTCFSGSTAPAQGSFSGSYAVWYDTTNKVIKLTNDGGSTWFGDNSFPLCVYSSTGTSASSIDQVFNGFGYIGSTIFALPGVEGLIPNGFVGKQRNNIKFKTSSVLTRTYGSNETYADADLMISSSQFTTNYIKYYNDKNLNIDSTGRTNLYVNCGIASFVNGRITSFNPKTVFQAADYNDVPKLAADNTFTGVNTFDNNGKLLLLDSAARTFNLKSTEYDITEKHAQEYYGIIRFSDKNDKEAGRFDVWNSTENETVARMLVFNKNGSLASIHVLLKDDGTVITYAPTPPTTDNSTQIANTKWVRQVAALKNLSNTSLTANRALYTNGSGVVTVSNVTSTELGYLDGVTSAIQTQLNAKANLASPAFSGSPTSPTPAVSDNSTKISTTNWFNQKIQVVSTLPASPNSNVYYFIPE